MSIYFAYGPKMDILHMKNLCPKAEVLMIQRLKRYRFIINREGLATLIPDPQSEVEGILWGLTRDCENTLDNEDKVRSGIYYKEKIHINPRLKTRLYLARDSTPGKSNPGYLEHIIASSIQHRFSEAYVNYLRSLF
jgi:hypothetical protein